VSARQSLIPALAQTCAAGALMPENGTASGAGCCSFRARVQSGLTSTLRNFTTPLSFATPLSSLLPKPC